MVKRVKKQSCETATESIDALVVFVDTSKTAFTEPFATVDENLTAGGELFVALFFGLQLLRDLRAAVPVECARKLTDRVAQTGNARLSWIALSRRADYTTEKTRALLVRNIVASGIARFAALAIYNGNGLDDAQRQSLSALAFQDPVREIQFGKSKVPVVI